MIAINMEYFEINREYISSKKFIVNCIYIILCLFTIIINGNYKRKNENRVQEEVKVEEKVEEAVGSANETVEEEILGIIRPVGNEVTFTSLEEELEEEVMETLKIYEFEGTGEQLRRLRAYNPKFDGETDEQYEKRIWDMAYEEDEEEAKQKVVNSVAEVASEIAAVVEENLPVSNEVVISSNEAETVVSKAENLERDVNTWYKFEDGLSRYKGEWKNGLPNGKGIKHFYKTDSYIEGNFVDSFAHGYGKQTFEQTQTWEKTAPYYEGEFNRNRFHGKGEYHYGDGDYYKGMWENNKYHGQGAAYSKRLDRTWVGEYENDVKGEGNWVKGELEQIKVEEVKVEEVLSKAETVLSKAETVLSKAETVVSKAENLENDVNTWYKFADGKGRYKGEWKNGLPNGKGIKHAYKDDSYIYGNFVDGFSEGYGKETFGQTWEKTQPYYEGEFKRNNYHGKGEYHYGDGDYYKGDWKDSKYNGQGAAYSKRLDRTWVGEYENDVKGEGNWVKGEI